MFTFDVEINGLDEEVKNACGGVEPTVQSALHHIGDYMKQSLYAHIESDFYKPFIPTVYQRRRDHPSYGTSLESPQTMKYDVTGMRLSFSYEPDGQHALPAPEGWNPDDAKSGDALIAFLTKDFAPERPFWNNFIDDLSAAAPKLLEAYTNGAVKAGENIDFSDNKF